jgi:hypothetical protein
MAGSRGKNSVVFSWGFKQAHAMQGHDSFYGGGGGIKSSKTLFFIACYFHNKTFSVFLLFKAWNNHRIVMQNIIFY